MVLGVALVEGQNSRRHGLDARVGPVCGSVEGRNLEENIIWVGREPGVMGALGVRTYHSLTGSKESLFSCALTASEEAMAVLEEVVLYVFQQCVYYVSKVRCVCPGKSPAHFGLLEKVPGVRAGRVQPLAPPMDPTPGRGQRAEGRFGAGTPGGN